MTLSQTATATPQPSPAPARVRGWHIWVVAGALGLLVAGSNLPTPLFPIYEHRYHFGSPILTVLFCTYVATLIPSLLTLGRLSDRSGRKSVIISGLALSAVSSVVFAAAHSLGWLFAGEAIYGVASGLMSSGAAAALRELHPTGNAQGSALGAAMAPSLGLALGPLASGALASATPWPTITPYLFDIGLVVAVLALLVRVPETAPRRRDTDRRAPLFHVPRSIRARFVAAGMASFTAWAVCGWVLALLPSFLGAELHVDRPAVSGGLVALMFGVSAVSQLAYQRWPERRALLVGLALQLAGFAVVILAVPTASLAVAVAGLVLLGVGEGGVLVTAMAALLADAPAAIRGDVTSAFYIVNYLGLSLPLLGVGELAGHLGISIATVGFGATLAAVELATLAAARVSGAFGFAPLQWAPRQLPPTIRTNA